MTTIKLSSALPRGDRNGLAAIAEAMLANPKGTRLAVVELGLREFKHAVVTGERTPTVEVLHVEPLPLLAGGEHFGVLAAADEVGAPGERVAIDATSIRDLLEMLYEIRTGNAALRSEGLAL